MKKKERIRSRRQKEKEKKIKRGKISRVKKRSLITASIFFIFVISAIVWQSLIVSFQEAVENPEMREKYVAKIAKELGRPDGVKEIIYAGTLEKIEYLKRKHNYQGQGGEKILMAALKKEEIVPGELRKKFTPEIIAIFPYAFSGEILKTEEDFRSSLLHEYRHIEVFLSEEAGGIKISVPPLILKGNEGLLTAVSEMDAVKKELESKLKLSSSYREDRYGHYLENYVAIWEEDWQEASPEFINNLKINFFEPWMRGRPELKIEIVVGRKDWYLEHPATKRKYYLPKDLFPGN